MDLLAAKVYTESTAHWNLDWLMHVLRGVQFSRELEANHANAMEDVILLGHFCEVEGPVILFRHPQAPAPNTMVLLYSFHFGQLFYYIVRKMRCY